MGKERRHPLLEITYNLTISHIDGAGLTVIISLHLCKLPDRRIVAGSYLSAKPAFATTEVLSYLL